LDNFANELQGKHMPEEEWWTLYVDGSSNPKGRTTRMVQEEPNHVWIKKSLHIGFKTSK